MQSRLIHNTVKSFEDCLKKQKNYFYLKNLQIRTDYTHYKTHFRNYHPKYFDVNRNLNKHIREVRDFKNLPMNTYDALYFDHESEPINGGLVGLIKTLKKSNALGNTSSALISPYIVINILYNMAERNINDTDFFQNLERTINTSNIKLDELDPRYSYGYLYAAYKTGLGRVENVLFFENYLEEVVELYYLSWIISLIGVYLKSTFFDKGKFQILMDNYFEDAILAKWEKELKYNTKNIAALMNILSEHKILKESLWDKFIDDCKVKTAKSYKPPQLIYYHYNLKNVEFILNEPKSHLYKNKEVKDLLENMKKLNRDVHETYVYDSDKMKFRTFDDMLTNKNDYTVDSHIGFSPIEETKEEVIIHKKVIVKHSTENIREEIKALIEKGEHILVVKKLMYDKFPNNDDEIEEYADEFTDLFNKLYIEKLTKEGRIDKLFEKYADPKLGASSTPTPGAGGDKAGEKGADQKKKKK